MAAGSMAKATVHEPTVPGGGKGLWGHKGWQLPAYIQHVFNDLVESGHPHAGETYRLAVGIVRNWAEGHDGKGGKVSATTQAAAKKAMAEWDAKKAATKGGGGKLREAATKTDDGDGPDAEGADDVDTVECPSCGNTVKPTKDSKCPKCGADLKRVMEAAGLPPRVTFEDIAAMAEHASRRLRLLEARGLPTTGDGATFDQLLVEAAAFDPSKHPRGATGSSSGGKFIAAGSSGTEVRAVQRRVGTRVDGNFDTQTQAAVRAFQKKHGLVVDGIVGRQTVAALRGRQDAKRVKIGALTAGDRTFLAGHVKGKGGTKRQPIVEAASTSRERWARWEALHNGWKGKVGGLQVGESARLRDGVHVKRTDRGYEIHARGQAGDVGARSQAVRDAKASEIKHVQTVASPDHAATLALQKSAQSDHPDSLGGTQKYSSLRDYEQSRKEGMQRLDDAHRALDEAIGRNFPESGRGSSSSGSKDIAAHVSTGSNPNVTHDGFMPDGTRVQVRKEHTGATVVEKQTSSGWLPNRFTDTKAAHSHFLGLVNGGNAGGAREQASRTKFGTDKPVRKLTRSQAWDEAASLDPKTVAGGRVSDETLKRVLDQGAKVKHEIVAGANAGGSTHADDLEQQAKVEESKANNPRLSSALRARHSAKADDLRRRARAARRP